MEGWTMRSWFLLALLLRLCSTHPVDISGEHKKVAAKAHHDNDGTHSHEETHIFSDNEIILGDIDVPGGVQGDIISIGHQLEINVNAHDHGGHSHGHDDHIHHDHDHLDHPALLIIDLQNDFITGSLKAPKAADIIGPISSLAGLSLWHKVTLSKDWHSSNQISFFSNLISFFSNLISFFSNLISFFSNLRRRSLDITWQSQPRNGSRHPGSMDPGSMDPGSMDPGSMDPGSISMFDKVVFAGPPPQEKALLPDHCVQGAEIHKDLVYPPDSNIVLLGTNPEVDSYSAFFDTGVDKIMADVTEVVVVGLSTDYCVGWTAIDALSLGISTTLLKDLSKPVTVEGEEDMLGRVREAGGQVETVDEWIKDLRIA